MKSICIHTLLTPEDRGNHCGWGRHQHMQGLEKVTAALDDRVDLHHGLSLLPFQALNAIQAVLCEWASCVFLFLLTLLLLQLLLKMLKMLQL